MKLRSKDLVCTLHSKNAPHLPKMHPFQKCTRLSEKCTLLFWKCTLKNQKCTRAFSLGAFFYQNMSTKPTERQGYVPTQIIEKREILTVRVSLSHFYPTLIRQLPSHFCFKTLLWVLAQAPPLRRWTERGCGAGRRRAMLGATGRTDVGAGRRAWVRDGRLRAMPGAAGQTGRGCGARVAPGVQPRRL